MDTEMEPPQTPHPPYRVSEFEQPKRDSKMLLYFLPHIIQIIVLIIIGSMFVFQRQSDVSTLSNNLSNLTLNVTTLTTTVENLKKTTDTNVSDLRLQAERNLDQDRRILASEEQLRSLVPDMREIKTKLTFVADLLDERTKQHK